MAVSVSMEELRIDDTERDVPSEIVCGWDLREDENNFIHAKLFLINHAQSNNVLELDMSYLIKPPQSFIDADSDFLTLLGCSNGLLLILQRFDYEKPDFVAGFNLVLWNPATRHFQKLPEPINPDSTPLIFHKTDIGFGKDSNNYKIVRITYVDDWLHIQLFTQKSGCWRVVATMSNVVLASQESAVVDGFVHWAIVLPGDDSDSLFTRFKILTFDLDTEELTEIDGPDFANRDAIFGMINHPSWYLTRSDFELFKWKGFVGLKIAYGNQFWFKNIDGWTKLPVSSQGTYECVFRDQLVFGYNNLPYKHLLIDPLTNEQTIFKDQFGNISPHNAYQYIPSLVSPTYLLSSLM